MAPKLKAFITQSEYDALPETIEIARDDAFSPAADGGHQLDVTAVGDWALDDIGGMRRDLGRLRTKAEDATGKHARATERLKSYEDDDGNALFDPEEAKAAMRAVKDGKVSGDQWETEKQRLKDGHERDISAKEEQIVQLESDRRMSKLEAEFRGIVAGDTEKGRPKGNPDLLWPHVKDNVRWHRLDDGREVLRIAGTGEDKYRYSDEQGSRSDPMGLGEYVYGDLRTKFGEAFDGSGTAGSGADKDDTDGAGAHGDSVLSADFEAL